MRTEQYRIMHDTEDRFWWYVGLREVLAREIMARRTGCGPCRILDAGCGTGGNLAMLASGPAAVGVDKSWEAVRLTRGRGIANVARASVLELPVRNACLDGLVSTDVLYHEWVTDDVEALREYHRVLRPGGWIVIHVAALDWLRGSHDDAVMGARRYTREQLRERMERVGFRVSRISYRNSLLLPAVILRRWLSRNAGNGHGDLAMPPRWMNRILCLIIRFENFMLRFIDMPVGSSLYCVGEKSK